MAQQRHLESLKNWAPEPHFTYSYEIRYTYVSPQDAQKSLKNPYPQCNRKSAILNSLEKSFFF